LTKFLLVSRKGWLAAPEDDKTEVICLETETVRKTLAKAFIFVVSWLLKTTER